MEELLKQIETMNSQDIREFLKTFLQELRERSRKRGITFLVGEQIKVIEQIVGGDEVIFDRKTYARKSCDVAKVINVSYIEPEVRIELSNSNSGIFTKKIEEVRKKRKK